MKKMQSSKSLLFSQSEEILIPTNIYKGSTSSRIITLDIDPVVLEKEVLFEKVAKIIAKVMPDKEFRQILKESASKKFDGDYDILVKNLLNNEKFTRKINKTLIEHKESTIETIVAENPRLNISIPLHLNNWDYEKKQLVVAAWQNEKSPYLNAYDSKGNTFKLSQDSDPDVPVVVVGFNERVNEKGILETTGNFNELN